MSHGDLLKVLVHENGENTFIRGWEGEFPKSTCSGLFGLNRKCNYRGSAALESSFQQSGPRVVIVIWSTCHLYVV